MSHFVCPWWLGYWLLNPLRKLRQNPHKILAPYLRPGMTVLEPGPGMGFFTMEIANLVGPNGRVIAVDVQPKMIDKLRRRLAKVGAADRVDTRVAPAHSMELADLRGAVGFVLAFAVVHEFPDRERFFTEVADASKRGASLLLVEPKGHVKAATFDAELAAAGDAGFRLVERPIIRRSLAALLTKM